jgi:hypothetical protein
LSRGKASRNSLTSGPCGDCQDNCCKRFFIILEDIRDRDWMKWLSFHRGVSIEKLGGRRIKVWFDYPCNHLRDDNSCDVYEKRPRMCREFRCEKLDALPPEKKKRSWFG